MRFLAYPSPGCYNLVIMNDLEGPDTTDWTDTDALVCLDDANDDLFFDDETGVVDDFPPSW